MGGAVATSLASAGWPVTGFDVDSARKIAHSVCGVSPASSLEHLLAVTDIIVTSLPSSEAVRLTAKSIAAARPTKIVIETSTLSLEDKLNLQEIMHRAGHKTLDCPLSGTGAQARHKDLVVYASGDSSTIRDLEPIFQSFARNVFDVGAYGNGTRLKLIANLLVAIHNVATAEAMTLASRAGLDLNQVIQLISAGAGTSRIFEQRAPMMAERCYEPASMKLNVWKKDLAVIMEFARRSDSPIPLFSATLPIYAGALEEGAEQDTAAVFSILSRMHHQLQQDSTKALS